MGLFCPSSVLSFPVSGVSCLFFSFFFPFFFSVAFSSHLLNSLSFSFFVLANCMCMGFLYLLVVGFIDFIDLFFRCFKKKILLVWFLIFSGVEF